MNLRIGRLAAGVLFLAGSSVLAGSAAAGYSVWTEPVEAWLCAPADGCSTEGSFATSPEAEIPPGFEGAFEGLTDIAIDGGAMMVYTDPSGRTLSLMAGASRDGEAGDTTSAGAAATISSSAVGNRIDERHGDNRVRFEGSAGGNHGIVSINQAAGHLNAQANLQAVGIGRGADAVVKASVAGSVRLQDNTIVSRSSTRENLIKDSFIGSAGIAAINQSAGNLNQQANTVALAIGIGVGDEAMALGESDLEAVSADNRLEVSGKYVRSDIITGSFGSFTGVAQATQSSGDGNIIRNNLTISVQVLQ